MRFRTSGPAMPENTLPMMTGYGQFGPMEMGGMFSVVRVRGGLDPNDYGDPRPYRNPNGTVAREYDGAARFRKGMVSVSLQGVMMCQSNDHSWFSWLRFC